MLHQNKTFRIFTFTVFLIILIPAMVQQGMFLDGITYSAISKNLADGIGTFWNPHYTNTLYPVFYEHPPLVFGLQSIFFKVFGNSFLTENIYSIFTCFLASIAIILIWNQPFKNSTQKNWSWIPLLLWITTPIIGFCFKNNLLENTLSVFTLFAVYFQIVSIQKNNYFYLVLGSLAIVSGFLSKGFVALFPLITIWIYLIVFKEFKNRKLLYLGGFSFLLPVLILFLLYFLIPGFHQNLDHYLSQQLIPAIQNQREVTTSSHFGLLLSLFIQLIIPISILLISLIFKYLKPQIPYFENHKISLFYLLIAFSASLPLLITLKQRPFYLVPSIPFFVLALSSFIFPFLKNILEKIPLKIHKWILWGSFLIVIGVITFSVGNFGKIKRDQVMIHEMEKISQIVPDHETIYTDPSVWENWTFTAYLSRYHNISLDTNHEQEYLLYPKKLILPEPIIQKYKLINCNLMNYDLYQKNNQ